MIWAAVVLMQADSALTSFSGSTESLVRWAQEPGASALGTALELREEPVIFASAQPVTREEMRGLLAELHHAEWVQTGDGRLTLRVKPEVLKAQQAEDIRGRVELLRQWIDSLPVGESPEKQVQNLRAEMQSFNERASRNELIRDGVLTYVAPTPARQLAASLLKAIGPEALTKREPDDSLTFATSPRGRYQKPFPRAAAQAFAVYESVMNQLSASLTEADKPSFWGPWEAMFFTLGQDRRNMQAVLTILPGPLITPAVRLRLYAGNGQLIDTVLEYKMLTQPLESEPTLPAWANSLPESWPLTEGNAQLADSYLAGPGLERHNPVVQPKFDGRILTDPNFEPLGLGLQELAMAVAQKTRKPVLLSPPDDASIAIRKMVTHTHARLTGMPASLVSQNLSELEETETGVWVRPKYPVDARRRRLSRAAVRKMAGDVIDIQGLSARTQVVYLRESRVGAYGDGLTGLILSSLLPHGLMDTNARFDHYEGSFLGSLSDRQWSEALTGRPILYSELNPTQRALFYNARERANSPSMRIEMEMSAEPNMAPYSIRIKESGSFLMSSGDPGQQSRFLVLGLIEGMGTNDPSLLAQTFTGRYDLSELRDYLIETHYGPSQWDSSSAGPFSPPYKARWSNVGFAQWPAVLKERISKLEFKKKPD